MPRGVKGSGPAKQPKAQQWPAKAPAVAAMPGPAKDEMTHPTDVDRMSGNHLKAYAKKVGVVQRDIDTLSDDRLRQCCKLMLADAYED